MSRKTIAKALKRLRMKSGLTADEVGALVGKSGKTVNAWENNRGQPDAEILMKLCDIYNVSNILEEFREDDDDKKQFSFTPHEKKLVTAYRNKPNMQEAVNHLLDIEHVDDNYNIEISQDIIDDMCESIRQTQKLRPPITKK